MFTPSQVLNPTTFIRHFSAISRMLRGQPQAILITQKHNHHLVLVNAEIFQELMEYRYGRIQNSETSSQTDTQEFSDL